MQVGGENQVASRASDGRREKGVERRHFRHDHAPATRAKEVQLAAKHGVRRNDRRRIEAAICESETGMDPNDEQQNFICAHEILLRCWHIVKHGHLVGFSVSFSVKRKVFLG